MNITEKREHGMARWKMRRLGRRHVYKGHCFDLVVDDVWWPNRKRLSRDLIIHPGISVIVPVMDRDHILMLSQYRYGAGGMLWEVPAGTIDNGESALDCAKREIQEEIGYQARKWKRLASCFASPGFNTEIIHCFLALHLKKTVSEPEDDEILECRVFRVTQVEKMIRDRKIKDAKSLVALFYFLGERA